MINLILIYLTLGVITYAIGRETKMGNTTVTLSWAMLIGMNWHSEFTQVEAKGETIIYQAYCAQWHLFCLSVTTSYLKRRDDLKPTE